MKKSKYSYLYLISTILLLKLNCLIGQSQRDDVRISITNKLRKYDETCMEIIRRNNSEYIYTEFLNLFNSEQVDLVNDFLVSDDISILNPSIYYMSLQEQYAGEEIVVSLDEQNIVLLDCNAAEIKILVLKTIQNFSNQEDSISHTLCFTFQKDYTISNIAFFKEDSLLKDRDHDRVVDKTDLCPEEYGIFKFCGCPKSDRDSDGIYDDDDDCPVDYGPRSTRGCPDMDGDDIPDKFDNCPTKKGIIYNNAACNGCPDSDNDKICDALDDCPNDPGLVQYKGCSDPDIDNDGLNNDIDHCPYQFGPKTNFGCPLQPKSMLSIGFTAAFAQPMGVFGNQELLTANGLSWQTDNGLAKSGYVGQIQLDYTPGRKIGGGIILGYSYTPFNYKAFNKSIETIHASRNIGFQQTQASTLGYRINWIIAKGIVGLLGPVSSLKFEPMIGFAMSDVFNNSMKTRIDYSSDNYQKGRIDLASGSSPAFGGGISYTYTLKSEKFPISIGLLGSYLQSKQKMTLNGLEFATDIPAFILEQRKIQLITFGVGIYFNIFKNHQEGGSGT